MNQFNTSIWGDEGFSAILSMKPTIAEIIRIIIHDTSPPLWNVTEHLAFQAFGNGETVIRGLSFTYYLLTVFFVYKIGAYLWTKKTGLWAAALTALNPFFFIYAFEGRMYSILALGVTASMYFFLKRKWTGYVIATAWALYSHHFAIFALFVQGLWFLKEFFFGEKKVAKKMFKAFVVVGIVYIPWMYPLYTQTKMVGGGFWLGTPTLTDLRNIVYDYMAQGIQHKLAEPALYIVGVAILLRNWHKSIEKSAFMLTWFLIPILMTWFISQHFQSIFYNRYLLYTIPGAMLILASKKRVPASNIVLAIVLVLFGVMDWHYFNHPTKKPFRELSSYVQEVRRDGDFLINGDAGNHHLWESKYYGIPAPIYVPSGDDLPFFVGTALMEDGDIIQTIPESAERVGVIVSTSVDDVNLPGYTESEIKQFEHGLNFVWYEKNDKNDK